MSARVAIGLTLLVLVAAEPRGGQVPMFSSRREAIRVDVLVTEDGRSVRGLRASDFEVLDNGVSQQVDLVAFEEVPLNLVLVLDTSDSMAGERLRHLQAAGHAVLGGLEQRDQAALVTFSHVIGPGSMLTKDVARIRDALDATEANGETALVDAVHIGMIVGESDVGRALVLVFSDGVDVSSWLSPNSVLEQARRSDVVVYGVSADKRQKPAFLQDVCRATGGRLLELESIDKLSATLVGILDEFRHRYLVSYSPRDVATSGWHRLQVRVKGRSVKVQARPGYFAGS
jgi:VWFA-related protein